MQAAQRHDGWTPDRTARFLDTLSHKGNVARAAAATGLSRETAYCRRRRDPLFARAWAAAMLLAREEGGHILADRALEGVEEQVWFRGEVVGTRIRYDNRLLLAHIARLDRLALDEAASADAARFDELVACLTGAQPPAPLAAANDDLPPDRASFADQAATAEADRQEEEDAGGFGEDAWERERREAAERIEQARAAAGEAWDNWTHDARTHVDTLLLPEPGRGTTAAGGGGGAPAASPNEADPIPSTVSDLSTSPRPVPMSLFAPIPTGHAPRSILVNAPAPLAHSAGMTLPGEVGHPPIRPNRHMRRASRMS